MLAKDGAPDAQVYASFGLSTGNKSHGLYVVE